MSDDQKQIPIAEIQLDGGAREWLKNLDDEFPVVLLSQLMVAVMSDGRWWTGRALKKRLKVYKGVITGTLDRLRRIGYVRRARNPKDPQVRITTGRWKHTGAQYVYQWTGRPWQNEFVTPEAYVRYVKSKRLPKAWRQLLD